MVRIALMSDIHFGKFSRTIEFSVPGEMIQDETKGGYSLQEGMIKILKEMDVKYLLIAGDLTSIASPQEYHYFQKKIICIANEIGVDHEHILCCLGNHDIDRKITQLSEQAINEKSVDDVKKVVKEKYNLMAARCALSNLEEIIVPEHNVGPTPFTGVHKENEFIVFVLNSGWQCAHDQDYPHGKLANKQLEWFQETAAQYKDDARVKIVLVHHHPFKYPYPIPSQDISEIEESSELMEMVKNNGIDIIVHGHRHHPIARTIQINSGTKPITLICAGSLSVNSEHRDNGNIPNTMHILELCEDNREFVLYNYKYTSAEGWKEMEYSNVTPLDNKMKLGKIFAKNIIDDAINNLPPSEMRPIAWDEIDESLQYLTYNDLNDRIRNLLSSKYKIIGTFPEEIIFFRIQGE